MSPQELAEYKQYLASQGFKPDEADQYIAESYGGAQPEQKEESYPKRIARGLIKSLPVAGSIAGGAVGLAGGPLGEFTVPAGAGLGGMLGRGLQYLGEYALDGQEALPKSYGEMAKEYGTQGLLAAGGEVAGNAAANALKPLGKSIYKSGLKAIDQMTEKFGKKPVSDLLLEHGITGSAGSIQKKIDALAEQLLGKRNDILKRATKAGGEVDIESALGPVKDKIAKIRASKNPDLQPLADALEKRAASYSDLAAKPETQALKELPIQGEWSGPRTEIAGFTPRSTETIVLPKSKLIGERQAVEFASHPDELINLPQSSSYRGPYRELNGLPVGQVQPPGTFTTLPDELGNNLMKYPTKFDAEIGQLRAPIYNQKPDAVGLLQGGNKVVPGLKQEAKYIPDIPEVGTYQTGGAIPGRRLPEQFTPKAPAVGIEDVPATMGPTPIQASGYKTSIGTALPDNAWRDSAMLGEAQSADRAFYGGMKRAVEKSVGKALNSAEQGELQAANDQLGRLLTSKDRALMEAAKEANKNAFTSVDGLLLGISNPNVIATKKLADILKTTGARTRIGNALYQAGPTTKGLIRLSPKAGLLGNNE